MQRAYVFKVWGCEIKNFPSKVSLQSCAQSVHIRFKQIQSVSAIGPFRRPTPLSKALVLHTQTQPNTMSEKLFRALSSSVFTAPTKSCGQGCVKPDYNEIISHSLSLAYQTSYK